MNDSGDLVPPTPLVQPGGDEPVHDEFAGRFRPGEHRPRRVLVTGLGTFWGGRVAQALEADPSVEVIVGLDTTEPTVELERTEYVRVDANYSILARIVRAAQVDTIIHTFLIVDPTQMSRRGMHEINVIGTMNLFAAASAPASTVRNVIVKSSTMVYGCAPEDPVWFTEETPRSRTPRTSVERSLDAVEGYVRDFAEDNPHVNVALLRFSNVIGADIETPLTRALELPVVPSIAGFDPRFQFVHEATWCTRSCSPWATTCPGSTTWPATGSCRGPRWHTSAASAPSRCPPSAPGSSPPHWPAWAWWTCPRSTNSSCGSAAGVDNRRLKDLGFRYEYTSAQAVTAFIEAVRLRRTVGNDAPAYRYERDVEQFFRHSPAVVRD